MTSARRIGEAVRARLGAERLWVRVAADEAEHEALQRWAEHAVRLAEQYAAPPVLDALLVEDRATLVFPHLDDPVATRADLARVADSLLGLLADLHADRELATALGPPVTAGRRGRAARRPRGRPRLR